MTAASAEAVVRYRLERVEDVAPGYIRAFTVEGRSIVLVCGDNGVRAVLNVCPHAGAPLHDGRVTGRRLRCPKHGYLFDLETGESSRGRREGFGPLRFLPVEEADGFYVVSFPSESEIACGTGT